MKYEDVAVLSEEERMSMERKELRTKRTLIYYITAAEKLLREGGLKNLTLRKVSQQAGYSSATLYSYFKDLDELIVYASMKYRKEYLWQLAREVRPDMNSLEQYRCINRLFNYYTFRSPEVFMNMYFSRHSENLLEITRNYYDLFPEEMVEQSTELVRELLLQNSIFDRDRSVVLRLAAEGFIQRGNAEMVLQILVRTHQSFLYDMTIHPDKDPDVQSEEFMAIFEHVIATN